VRTRAARSPARRALWSAILAWVFLAPAAPADAGESLTSSAHAIRRNVAGSQGQLMTGTGLSLNTTVGETAFAGASGGALAVSAGYMPHAAQPGSVVSITAATKSTGTLELSWTAPGVDGFQGDVVSGFYRVDYSADPSHVFSPTVFQAEFSTTVAAGSAQQLSITGLSPNTTYYTKIYLADARKAFAEDSRRSDESTLANAPNPQFSGVFPCSATITWPLPAGGAENYDSQASSTNFGALTPGGAIKEGSSPQLSMTITGLSPGTTYYFKVASLNWQSEKNFSTIVATTTPAGICLPTIAGLSASGNALARTVTLTWSNPSAPAPQGVVVVLSTNSAVALSDGATLSPGQTLPDGSTVKATVSATGLGDSGLTLDSTYYYHVFTQYAGPTYSVSVSTAVFLDLAPMTPANFAAAPNGNHTLANLSWNAVASNNDGSLFIAPGAPIAAELRHYRVERSTVVATPNWISITTVSAASTAYADDISAVNQTVIYRVVSVDTLGNESPSVSLDVDNGNTYVYASDEVTRLSIPPDIYQEMLANSSFPGTDTVIRAVDVAGATSKTLKAVRFEAVGAVGTTGSKPLQFSKPTVQVVLSYDPALGPNGVAAVRPADDALSSLSLYWDNGSGSFIKLFGNVDQQNHTVSAMTGMTGTYEVRPLVRPTGFNFDISSLSNKMLTPNGDGLNDAAVFLFDNPRDSGYAGKIYDLTGSLVADMSQGPIPSGTGQGSLQWDGKAGGRVVPGGVYVYVIKAEGKSFSGTLVVIR
jgi:hypothetical protein